MPQLAAVMIAAVFRCWGLRPKSEIPDPASSAHHRLVIEWTARL